MYQRSEAALTEARSPSRSGRPVSPKRRQLSSLTRTGLFSHCLLKASEVDLYANVVHALPLADLPRDDSVLTRDDSVLTSRDVGE
jgi:hypothetical protein